MTQELKFKHMTANQCQIPFPLHIYPSLKQGSLWRKSVFRIINIAATLTAWSPVEMICLYAETQRSLLP